MATQKPGAEGIRPRYSYWNLPPINHQSTYAATGALAGACTVPIEPFWNRLSSPRAQPLRSLVRNTGFTAIYRGGVRFWVFDLAKSLLNRSPLPVWTVGGLSGAAGGFAEVCVQALVNRKSPSMVSLANQSSKLFLCFGTYTYLSTSLSDQSPPKPFWYCWLLGAVAGGFGSTVIARAEGIKGMALVRGPLPKGMATIGTVIAVQVTSCAKVLERIEA